MGFHGRDQGLYARGLVLSKNTDTLGMGLAGLNISDWSEYLHHLISGTFSIYQQTNLPKLHPILVPGKSSGCFGWKRSFMFSLMHA